ncbi:hypothetical protein RRG08_054386 [Elysia crispata]|uniref:Uncharacterized protein n=1 Tax=Elysia crispata TaxID=231223 RepID=A0AAE1EA96_9GAST|nr:hypothetical protein RRG08_054386 [Elysia crispata]
MVYNDPHELLLRLRRLSFINLSCGLLNLVVLVTAVEQFVVDLTSNCSGQHLVTMHTGSSVTRLRCDKTEVLNTAADPSPNSAPGNSWADSAASAWQ